MAVMVEVPLRNLTDRQLHIYLLEKLHLLEEVHESQLRIEANMADLSKSVEDLQAAVDGVASRFAGQLAPLTEALAEAQAALDAAEIEDEEQNQALADALSKADNAASAIDEQVNELNSLGADPETPVEPEAPAE